MPLGPADIGELVHVLVGRHAAQGVAAVPRGDREGLVDVVDRESHELPVPAQPDKELSRSCAASGPSSGRPNWREAAVPGCDSPVPSRWLTVARNLLRLSDGVVEIRRGSAASASPDEV
jgi:hypothetical protein